MAKESKIDYVDSTWNPVIGCTPVSAGCTNCYARRSWRLLGLKPGEVRRAADATFHAPLKWKEPKRIMVCSISDFFHEAADEWRQDALWIMEGESRHTFIIPTKRPERMIECLYNKKGRAPLNKGDWLPNVWFLASVENQEMADKRSSELLKLREYGDWPVLGLSVEPMLGEINIKDWLSGINPYWTGRADDEVRRERLNWIICGAESGSKARPCDSDWVRSLRDQCIAVGVPFFFKQIKVGSTLFHLPLLDGRQWKEMPNDQL